MSPSSFLAVASTWSRAAAFSSRTASSSASRASSCMRVRSSSAFFAAISSLGDPDPLDGRLRLVAQDPDAGDDRRVLVLDPVR